MGAGVDVQKRTEGERARRTQEEKRNPRGPGLSVGLRASDPGSYRGGRKQAA